MVQTHFTETFTLMRLYIPPMEKKVHKKKRLTAVITLPKDLNLAADTEFSTGVVVTHVVIKLSKNQPAARSGPTAFAAETKDRKCKSRLVPVY